jgi:hypothetical protein
MRDKSFSIKSACSDREIRFLSIEGDYFEVELYSQSVAARRRVWGYTDCDLLVDLFCAMAQSVSGWSDALKWSSIEGELCFSCACDRLGHVFIDIELTDDANGGEFWCLKSRLQTELGQLPRIASDVRSFFAPM